MGMSRASVRLADAELPVPAEMLHVDRVWTFRNLLPAVLGRKDEQRRKGNANDSFREEDTLRPHGGQNFNAAGETNGWQEFRKSKRKGPRCGGGLKK